MPSSFNQMNSSKIGKLIRSTRKKLRITQQNLAFISGTGLRFIIELEKGKPTCQLEKALTVMKTLGIKIILEPPGAGKQ